MTSRLDAVSTSGTARIAGMPSTLDALLIFKLESFRCSLRRVLRRELCGVDLSPADTIALLAASEQPGVDQTALGRILAGNRSVGMKAASRLEAVGLVERRPGRDRRSKGIFATARGKRLSGDLLKIYRTTESLVTAGLSGNEKELLMTLLAKLNS